jgi:hypothetical protein
MTCGSANEFTVQSALNFAAVITVGSLRRENEVVTSQLALQKSESNLQDLTRMSPQSTPSDLHQILSHSRRSS